MTDYSKGYAYQVVNDVDDEIYVGSSCRAETKRMSDHRSASKKPPERTGVKLYAKMVELGVEYFRLVVLERRACKNKAELRQLEEKWRLKLKPILNTRRCYIDPEVRRMERNAARKKYSEEHSEQEAARKLAYRTNAVAEALANKTYHCELCNASFGSSTCLKRHQGGLAHRQAMATGIAPPPKLSAVTCEVCNSGYSSASALKRHYKSLIHIKNVAKADVVASDLVPSSSGSSESSSEPVA